MKLSFLVQLILLLLLVLSIYLVFTNRVSGKTKLIIIVFCVVLGLYLYSKLNLFSNYNEYYSSPESARDEYTIDSTLLKKGDGQFTISLWIFIDDWNYRYGEKKVILRKSIPSNSGNVHLPSIELGKYKNDLKISVNTYETGSENQDNDSSFQTLLGQQLEDNGVSYDSDAILSCSGEEIYIDSESSGYECMSADSSGGAIGADLKSNSVTIENINMQKWVNVITTVNNRSVDVYINGKLLKTKTFNNVIDTNAFNYGNIQITPNGGFGGYVSKIRYYPNYITPQEAWNIYKDGFGDAFASTLNKYNVSLTFYEDQVEQNKFFLF